MQEQDRLGEPSSGEITNYIAEKLFEKPNFIEVSTSAYKSLLECLDTLLEKSVFIRRERSSTHDGPVFFYYSNEVLKTKIRNSKREAEMEIKEYLYHAIEL